MKKLVAGLLTATALTLAAPVMAAEIISWPMARRTTRSGPS